MSFASKGCQVPSRGPTVAVTSNLRSFYQPRRNKTNSDVVSDKVWGCWWTVGCTVDQDGTRSKCNSAKRAHTNAAQHQLHSSHYVLHLYPHECSCSPIAIT